MGTCDVTHWAMNVYIENILLLQMIHGEHEWSLLIASLFCETDSTND